MDGNFTKIIYSNQWFTINSIFIHFPIEWLSVEKIANKSILRFNPYSPKNLPIVQDFAKFETRNLEYFKTFGKLHNRTTNTFSKQLYTGNMKIFKEYVDPNKVSYDDYISPQCFGISSRSSTVLNEAKRGYRPNFRNEVDESFGSSFTDTPSLEKMFVIKISGIWENYEEIGLTFKLMEQGGPIH